MMERETQEERGDTEGGRAKSMWEIKQGAGPAKTEFAPARAARVRIPTQVCAQALACACVRVAEPRTDSRTRTDSNRLGWAWIDSDGLGRTRIDGTRKAGDVSVGRGT